MTEYDRAVADVREFSQTLAALWPFRNAWGGGDVVNEAIKLLQSELEAACKRLVNAMLTKG